MQKTWKEYPGHPCALKGGVSEGKVFLRSIFQMARALKNCVHKEG